MRSRQFNQKRRRCTCQPNSTPKRWPLIKAGKILNAQGLAPDTNVKTICQAAGISRKTGCQWANKLMQSSDLKQQALREELEELISKCVAVIDKSNNYAN